MIGSKEHAIHGGCHPRELQKSLKELLSKLNPNIKPNKRQRVIAWLVAAFSCNCKVTRFDAEWVGDHCFNTTISEIGRYHGIKILRRETKRPTRFGVATDCKEYWLSDDGAVKAEQFLSENLACNND